MVKNTFCSLVLLILLQPFNIVVAGGNNAQGLECPVGLVTDMTLDDEFGPGSAEITHCMKRRNQVKLLIQVNEFCLDRVPNPQCNRPYGLINLPKMIDDYEITHGMKLGRDLEIAVIAHTRGGPLMLKDETKNQFRSNVESLLERGVKFYLCQNATRAMIRNGLLPAMDATANIIDGVEYVTAGLTAVADFQYQGYVYVQP